MKRVGWPALASVLALSCLHAHADDGARAASSLGCLNCHGQEGQSSPSLRHLVDRAARRGDNAEALQDLLQEMREHGSVHSHRMPSDASALVVLRWMAHGAP